MLIYAGEEVCMKTLASVLQWVLGILALAIAVLSLSPSEWKQKLLIWSALVHLTNSVILLMMTLVVAASAVNFWRTRKKCWDTTLLQIIQVCEKLVIVDSYQGSKHQFWTSIENRLKEDRPFHFVLLDLAKGDPMLAYCMDTSMVHSAVADIDLKAIDRLLKERDASGKGGNKTIEFGPLSGQTAEILPPGARSATANLP